MNDCLEMAFLVDTDWLWPATLPDPQENTIPVCPSTLKRAVRSSKSSKRESFQIEQVRFIDLNLSRFNPMMPVFKLFIGQRIGALNELTQLRVVNLQFNIKASILIIRESDFDGGLRRQFFR